MSLTSDLARTQNTAERLLDALRTMEERIEKQRLEGRAIGWHECALAYENKLREIGVSVEVPNPYWEAT